MKLTFKKGKQDKIHISVDGEYSFTVDETYFLSMGIWNGKEVDSDELEEIKQVWEDGLGILEAGALFVNTGKIGNFVCHARRGAYWVYPVYEQIRAFGNKKVVSKILLNDEWVSNDRMNNYLSLIDLALAEYPEKKDYFLREKQEILRNLEMCEVHL